MNNSSYSTIDTLRKHGFNLKKSLGQNFLADPNISKKIVRLSGITNKSNVLEIGPGAGALTTQLCQIAKMVIAVELDIRLIPVLNDVLSIYKNIELIHGDILKVDIKTIINERFASEECQVCANLPYNITTPALQRLIETDVFDNITVMIQREVARRICAKPGTTDYGAFTLYINYHSIPEILFDVPPECFIPKPKVFSSVVNMKIRESKLLKPDEEKMLFKTIRASFEQRRKTLVNCLFSYFRDYISKDTIENKIINCGFDPKIRGEMLSLEDFIYLSKQLHL